MAKNDFFAFASRTRFINRWALMRNTRYETLSEHSYDVAQIAHALAVIGNEKLNKNYNTERAALIGLYHDLPEIITGDLPTPVKYYNEETKTAYKAVEKNAANQLLDMLPEYMRKSYSPLLKKKAEDKELWKLVKAADKISAYIKCVGERKAGNSEFVDAEKSTLKLLQKLNCPEADIFMEEFASSYEKSLDELK